VGLGRVLPPEVTCVTNRPLIVADVQVHGRGGFAGDGDVVIPGEADHVGELPPPRRVGEVAVFRTLKGDTPLDADPGPGAGDRADAEDEDVIRPARVTHDVVALEVLPQNPVVDARTAHPALEQSMREDFRANLPAR